jgi:uncharacterized membrane protein
MKDILIMQSFVYSFVVYLALLSATMLVGLMTTLLTVMRPMWARQTDVLAAQSLQQFLAYAATNRVLSTLSILPVICSIVIIFIGAKSTSQLVYALVGGGVFLLGFFIWTAIFNLPIYKTVTKWDTTQAPDDVRSILRRFHVVNLVRLTAAFATSILFFLAK